MHASAEDLDLCSKGSRGFLDVDLKRTHQTESVVGGWQSQSSWWFMVLDGARLYGSLQPLVARKQRSLSGPELESPSQTLVNIPLPSSILKPKLTFSPIGIDASRSRPPRP